MTQTQKFSISPVAITIVAIWVLNDLVLKPTFGNFWTGKISDITGLVAFPFFICIVLTGIFKKIKEVKLFTISILLVHSVFTLINIRQDWNDFYQRILFSNHHGTADLEDLFCIPVTIPILYFLFFRIERITRVFLPKVLFPVLCTFAFMGTSYLHPTIREFKVAYPIEKEVKSREIQTFIWYSMECNYNGFRFALINDKYFYNSNYLNEFEYQKVRPTLFSKSSFENMLIREKYPVAIQITKKDFYSAMDTRYKKMRFELDLKMNVEPGKYKWCIQSEEKYEHSCILALDEREDNPQYSKENNARDYTSKCGSIFVK